ncbi:hypothetical protein A3Q56_06566 [Intoshia linei]|uniref:Uncharacterized protein n=1 Tax=Intoshia linei TaxID=1819745 RepID=A0A177AUP3_9BILA|nr:hypothetical protein A3Q56_06566 [Intoshia linei]
MYNKSENNLFSLTIVISMQIAMMLNTIPIIISNPNNDGALFSLDDYIQQYNSDEE